MEQQLVNELVAHMVDGAVAAGEQQQGGALDQGVYDVGGHHAQPGAANNDAPAVPDNAMPAPVINTNISLHAQEPPSLKRFDRESLIEFRKNVVRYRRVLEDGRNRGAAAYPISLKHMIGGSLMNFLVQHHFHKLPQGTTGDNVTDQQLQFIIDDYLGADASSVHRIRETVVSKLKMRMDLPPRDRISHLVQDFDDIIESNNFNMAFASRSGPKNYIRLLCDLLQPAEFKLHMKDLIRWQKSELEDDKVGFVRELYRKVETYDNVFKYSRPPSSTPSSSNAKKARTIKCLKCQKDGHHVKACPMKPSAAEQKQLIAQYKILKNKPSKSSAYIIIAKVANSDSMTDRYINILLADGKLICKAVLDSGADATLISNSTVNKLKDLDKNLQIRSLNPSLTLQLPNSQFIEVAKAIDIDMKLETKAGQLILLNQTCIIWDQLNTDFLLGNDILTTLGIDPKNALDALIGNHDTENIDEIEFSHLEIGEDIDSDIFNLIKSKVNEALSNGLNPKYKSTLIELLISHRDVFRVKLGPDLPACVEPFKTELVKNWKPIKCHARRYTKEQSEFLNDFTTLLQKYGLIYENYNAKWASPVQVVKKAEWIQNVCGLESG
jgi:hypothetical protein